MVKAELLVTGFQRNGWMRGYSITLSVQIITVDIIELAQAYRRCHG